MFDKRLAWTGAALALVAAFALLLTKLPEQAEVAPITETVSDVEREADSASFQSRQPGYAYLIREHEGRVAVFAAGSDQPELILDVLVKHLPDYDQNQMKDGIPVADYNALVTLIEDYIS